MSSRSYLRSAISSFISSEIDDVELLAFDTVDEVTALSTEQLAAINLILIHCSNDLRDHHDLTEDVAAMRRLLGAVPVVLLGDGNESDGTRKALRLGAEGFIPESTHANIVKHALPLIAVGGVFLPGPNDNTLDKTPDKAPDKRPDKTPDKTHGNGPDTGPDTGRGTTHGMAERQEAYEPPKPDHAPPGMIRTMEIPTSEFTERELDVLRLLGNGLQNKLIAYELGVKESTVKVHVRHIMRKLRATSRTQAALFAQRRFLHEAQASSHPDSPLRE